VTETPKLTWLPLASAYTYITLYIVSLINNSIELAYQSDIIYYSNDARLMFYGLRRSGDLLTPQIA